jgi:hypothetical protein
VAEKLLIKSGNAVWISDPARQGLIGPLPGGARFVDKLGDATVAVVYAADAAGARAVLLEHGSDLARTAVVWVAYPKGNRADINRDTLWPIVAEHGMRPITQVAVDDVWSALRFRPLKEGEEQFAGGRQGASA